VTSTDEHWLRQAVALAVTNVTEGGGPFGAVVVHDGELVATGQNRVTRDHDPSAHAEVLAIRTACAQLGAFSLAGATLYASCEPCPMCLATTLWARLDRVVYAADRDDAARAGFDDRAFHDLFGTDRARAGWPSRLEQHRLDESDAPFDAWLAKGDRAAY